MKKILLMTGIAALTLSSCSQEDVISVNDKNADNLITFRVRSQKLSRASEFSTYNLDDFMVFGFKGDADEGEELLDYFENGDPLKFTRDGLLFTSEIPYYYPGDGSWLSFAAYAPSNLKMTKADKYGGIKIDNFTVESDITKQIDIIFADGGSNLEPDEPDQELTFKHALSKVYISEVRNSDTRFKYEIMGVKFGNIHNSGNIYYKGEKALNMPEGEINETFNSDGYIRNGDGRIALMPTGDQNNDMEYIFNAPIILDKSTTTADVMSGSDTEAVEAADKTGSFMMIPQQLSSAFLNEEGELNSGSFDSGMSYIAFLVRITNLITNEVIYPYAERVEAISKTIGEHTYAWAAFPVSTLWVPGLYTDYLVDFSKGAGFVAPGADEEIVGRPILGREIKFTITVGEWDNGGWITIDEKNQLGVDVADDEDPFGE
ncbi:MAG: fimbrillin family protein [Paramuribaculum sp.]|nr:fimbrillin family protein [Paramuribaculum sp.]